MDPNACLQRIVGALAQGAVDDARDAYADLVQWISRGGFAPRAFQDHPEIHSGFRRGFARFARTLQDTYLTENGR